MLRPAIDGQLVPWSIFHYLNGVRDYFNRSSHPRVINNYIGGLSHQKSIRSCAGLVVQTNMTSRGWFTGGKSLFWVKLLINMPSIYFTTGWMCGPCLPIHKVGFVWIGNHLITDRMLYQSIELSDWHKGWLPRPISSNINGPVLILRLSIW